MTTMPLSSPSELFYEWLEKRPGEDKYLQSGDVIVVPRTWL